MVDNKQIRKIARCIQTLLENEGIKVKPAKVVNIIKDKDLSNIPALKDEVVNDMREKGTNYQVSKQDRRKELEVFCVAHWDTISKSPSVKDALFNAYSQGRYTKEQRQNLKNNLLAICNGDNPPDNTATDEETVMANDDSAELAASLMGVGTHYDF